MVKKTGLVLLFLMIFAAGVVASSVYWIQTPAGEKTISDWLTRQMEPSVPKTDFRLQGISVRFPLEIQIQRVTWRTADAEPIAMISPCVIRLRPQGFSFSRLHWEMQGQVTRLKMAPLDRAIGHGEWRASGEAAGTLRAQGSGARMDQIRFQAEMIQPAEV